MNFNKKNVFLEIILIYSALFMTMIPIIYNTSNDYYHSKSLDALVELAPFFGQCLFIPLFTSLLFRREIKTLRTSKPSESHLINMGIIEQGIIDSTETLLISRIKEYSKIDIAIKFDSNYMQRAVLERLFTDGGIEIRAIITNNAINNGFVSLLKGNNLKKPNGNSIRVYEKDIENTILFFGNYIAVFYTSSLLQNVFSYTIISRDNTDYDRIKERFWELWENAIGFGDCGNV